MPSETAEITCYPPDDRYRNSSATVGLGPVFFSLHTVTELRFWRDMDLAAAKQLELPMIYNASTDKFEGLEWTRCFAIIAACPTISVSNSPLSEPKAGNQDGAGRGSAQRQPYALGSFHRKSSVVAHLVKTLRREHLALGRTTLLLPCATSSGEVSKSLDAYRADNGGWPLPEDLIRDQIAQRRNMNFQVPLQGPMALIAT